MGGLGPPENVMLLALWGTPTFMHPIGDGLGGPRKSGVRLARYQALLAPPNSVFVESESDNILACEINL